MAVAALIDVIASFLTATQQMEVVFVQQGGLDVAVVKVSQRSVSFLVFVILPIAI